MVFINIFNLNSTYSDKIDDCYEYERKDEDDEWDSYDDYDEYYEEYFKYVGINLKYTNRENKTIIVCTEKKNLIIEEDRDNKLIKILNIEGYNAIIETFKYKFWFLRVFDSKPKLFIKWLKEQKENCNFNKFFVDCL